MTPSRIKCFYKYIKKGLFTRSDIIHIHSNRMFSTHIGGAPRTKKRNKSRGGKRVAWLPKSTISVKAAQAIRKERKERVKTARAAQAKAAKAKEKLEKTYCYKIRRWWGVSINDKRLRKKVKMTPLEKYFTQPLLYNRTIPRPANKGMNKFPEAFCAQFKEDLLDDTGKWVRRAQGGPPPVINEDLALLFKRFTEYDVDEYIFSELKLKDFQYLGLDADEMDVDGDLSMRLGGITPRGSQQIRVVDKAAMKKNGFNERQVEHVMACFKRNGWTPQSFLSVLDSETTDMKRRVLREPSPDLAALKKMHKNNGLPKDVILKLLRIKRINDRAKSWARRDGYGRDHPPRF